MRVAKMKLPEIELTPEQSEDRITLQPLFALDQALKDLQDYGIKIGPEGITSEVEGMPVREACLGACSVPFVRD